MDSDYNYLKMYDEISSSSNVYKLPKGADKSAGRWTDEEHKMFIIGMLWLI